MELRLKFFIVSLLLVNVVFGIAATAAPEVVFKKGNLELTYKKSRKIINVELAETPDQHERGLMFRKKLNINEGMLFIFTDEQTRSFWMKNTLIDLDIGYFDKKKTLIDIQQMKAENSVMQLNPPAYPSKRPAMYALEMSKGWFKKNNFPEGTALKLISRP